MLLRGERADEPGPRDPDCNQENARPRRVLHCGKDCASIKVKEVQADKGYQDDMRVMFVAPVLEGEGDDRGERPPEPRDRREHEEKEPGVPPRQACGQPSSLCRLTCRWRTHQHAPFPEMSTLTSDIEELVAMRPRDKLSSHSARSN